MRPRPQFVRDKHVGPGWSIINLLLCQRLHVLCRTTKLASIIGASLTYGCAILHQNVVSFSGATQHSKRTSLICRCVNIFMYFSCLAQLGFRCTTLVGMYEEDHKVLAMVGYDNLPNLPNRLQNKLKLIEQE